MMDRTLRRRFLRASRVANASTAPLPASARVPPYRPEHALVLITLYGGNDGLSTVVPYADDAYHAARLGLTYDPPQVLDLGAGIGLNPALTGMYARWQRGDLAVVHGVGYPRPNRSHFASMDIWQTASAGEPAHTGWLGRWLDTFGGADPDPLRAMSLGSVLPPLLVGATTAGVAIPLSGLAVPDRLRLADLRALSKAGHGQPDLAVAGAAALGDFLTVREILGPVFGAWRQRAKATAPLGVLARQLEFVSACLHSGVSTQVYEVSLGGFDSHADTKTTQTALLRELDVAVSGFLEQVDGAGTTPTVLIYSEFGRRVAANDSQGTDHGTAGPVLLLGSRVRGGSYGEPPSLTDLDDGDLKFSTDFRSVYATVLAGLLATDPVRILGREYPIMPLLRADKDTKAPCHAA